MPKLAKRGIARANPTMNEVQRGSSLPLAVFLAMVMASNTHADERSNLRAGIEDRVKGFSTADVIWAITSVYTESGRQDLNSRDPFDASGTEVNFEGKLPATFEWQARLRCDGQKLRVEYARPTWDVRDARFTLPSKAIVFDGSAEKFLMTDEEDPFPYRGVISKPPLQWGHSMDFAPLLWHFRAFAYPGMFGERFFNVDANESTEIVDGVSCAQITHVGGRDTNSAGKEVIWLDAKPPYSVRRFVQIQGGQVKCEFDVDRVETLDGCVVPYQWRVEEHNVEGRFNISSHAKVVKATVNQPIDASFFKLAFPNATIVWDKRGADRRFLVVGSGQQEFEVTPRQVADAGSAQQLLHMFEN